METESRVVNSLHYQEDSDAAKWVPLSLTLVEYPKGNVSYYFKLTLNLRWA